MRRVSTTSSRIAGGLVSLAALVLPVTPAGASAVGDRPVSPALASPSLPHAGGPAADPPDPRLALAVAEWVTDGGDTKLTTLETDFNGLETAASSSDLPTISASCAQLRTDVEAAQSYDPIPDAEAQQDWSDALAEYALGATDCVAGANTANSGLITQASSEIVTGTDDLTLVTTRLNAIAGP